MFGHTDTTAAAAAGWVPWPRGWHAAAVCWWHDDIASADVTFCMDEDSAASLISFPPSCSFPSPSVSTHDCHPRPVCTLGQYIPQALMYACSMLLYFDHDKEP